MLVWVKKLCPNLGPNHIKSYLLKTGNYRTDEWGYHMWIFPHQRLTTRTSFLWWANQSRDQNGWGDVVLGLWLSLKEILTSIRQICSERWRPTLQQPTSKFGEFPFLIISPLGLWGDKNWLPRMKVKSWKIFRTKWAERAANGPVWMPQALKSIRLIQFCGWENSL